MPTPEQIIESAYQQAQENSSKSFLSKLKNEHIEDLKTIVDNANAQKAVLGVTLTSLVYKVYKPEQDIRIHQEGMEGGYSGRTFDTKYVTPFLKQKFPRYAMAESAWLTRSLEQPHPYSFEYPGKIRNQELKHAFLRTLDRVQSDSNLAHKFLVALMGLMLEATTKGGDLLNEVAVTNSVTIPKIVEAFNLHIHHKYGKGNTGTARLPVLTVYSVYELLMCDVKRYEGKVLAPLEAHTSPDSRSKLPGDINVLNHDGTCFESVEIKHDKPIDSGMVDDVYRKIRGSQINRYYILTTKEPNFDDDSAMRRIEELRNRHPCQIIVNGVIPSLKYYIRLTRSPQDVIERYNRLLKSEYGIGVIKPEHLKVWAEICKTKLGLNR